MNSSPSLQPIQTSSKWTRWIYSFVTILLSVTLISTFIGAFFFTYGNQIEEQIVKDQSAFLATDIAKDIKVFPGVVGARVADGMKTPDMSAMDIQAEEHNKVVRSKAFKVLGIIFLVGLVVSIGIAKWQKLPLWNIVRENLVLLLAVAVVEFIFLTFVIQNVYIIDPDLRLNVFRDLKSRFMTDSKNSPGSFELILKSKT